MMKKIAYIIIFLLMAASAAMASESQNVRGWAYSDNLGWISLNHTIDKNATDTDYGVNINRQGYIDVSSYAYLGQLGNTGASEWITFDPDVAGSPPSDAIGGGYLARARDGKLSGWARAISACPWDAENKKCTGAGAAPGSEWDGWIKLSGKAQNGDDYGVELADGSSEDVKIFKGWAWAGDYGGWISFNCQDGGKNKENICADFDYGVETTFHEIAKPFADNLQLAGGIDFCKREMSFGWTYHGSSNESKFEIWISEDPSVPDSASTIKISGSRNTLPEGTDEISVNMENADGKGTKIKLDTLKYYWKVKVWDSEDPAQESDLSKQSAAEFATDTLYPDARFEIYPDYLTKEITTKLDASKTQCWTYVDGVKTENECFRYIWTIEPSVDIEGNKYWDFADVPGSDPPIKSTLSDKIVYINFFDDLQAYKITLIAEGPETKSCGLTLPLENERLKWREGIPDNVFYRTFDIFLGSIRNIFLKIIRLSFNR